MHDQKCPSQAVDSLVKVCGAHILDEVTTEDQCPSTDEERRLSVAHDAIYEGVVVVLDVAGLVGRADADDSANAIDQVRRGYDGCAAERVTHQQPDWSPGRLHEPDCLGGVLDLVGERAVAPVALRVAQTEVVEPQHADSLAGQLFADA